MPDVSVSFDGPIFDGRADSEAARFCEALEGDIAAQVYADVMFNLNRSIKRPTPYYETQITTQRLGDARVVHDRGVVYGPWLEGTSERNRTTRFKGYASFRRAAQSVNARIPAFVERQIERLVERLSR